MEWVFGIVAFLIALAGLLVALGHIGYLAMLNSAAKKRGLSGNRAADLVRSRWAVAGGTAAAAAIGLLLTTGGIVPDVLGALIAGGAGLVARQGLESTRKELRGGH